jgi:medium-chain acyl-[acyl-carrier-protein] hydrolase
MDELVEYLAGSMTSDWHKPFAFLGHSMGGLVAFELARLMRRKHLPGPQHIFISAYGAPHLPKARPPIHRLPDLLLRAELLRLQGTPIEVLRDKELLRLWMPVLRADLRICENYSYRAEAPLNCAITCLGGLSDRRVSRIQMVAWKRHTTGPFRLRLFPGNHFFLYEKPDVVGEAIVSELKTATSGPVSDSLEGAATSDH